MSVCCELCVSPDVLCVPVVWCACSRRLCGFICLLSVCFVCMSFCVYLLLSLSCVLSLCAVYLL